MTVREAPPKSPILHGRGTVFVVTLGLLASPAFGSTSVSPDCPEAHASLDATEVTAPALSIDVIERGISAPSGIDDELEDAPLEPATAPLSTIESSTDALIEKIFEADRSADEKESAAFPSQDASPAASRVPEPADDRLPRFRRQMYRTDI